MPDQGETLLLLRTSRAVVGLPIATVVETLRPLACAPIAGAPPELLGLSVIRGEPVPVVDLARALGHDPGPATRFVTVRAGARTVALQVEAVLGTSTLAPERMAALPPLLGDASQLGWLGRLDHELLLVLEAGRFVPPESAGD